MTQVDFSELKNKIFTRVYRDDEEIVFEKDGRRQYVLLHEQDCCESVTIDDICGNLSDLENSEILMAYEATNTDLPPKDKYDYSYTWTFYKLATAKGYVDIRFYGESNGYYSEKVELFKYDENDSEANYHPVFFSDIIKKIKDPNKTVLVLRPDGDNAYYPHIIKEVEEKAGKIIITLE